PFGVLPLDGRLAYSGPAVNRKHRLVLVHLDFHAVAVFLGDDLELAGRFFGPVALVSRNDVADAEKSCQAGAEKQEAVHNTSPRYGRAASYCMNKLQLRSFSRTVARQKNLVRQRQR